MRVEIEVSASIIAPRGVAIAFLDVLEVSLACATCRKTFRTVLFEHADELGICCKLGHPYDGRIGRPSVTKTGWLSKKTYVVSLQLSYEYTALPYPESNPIPEWGRVHFTATCARCRRTREHSVQNNERTPDTWHCECGAELYTQVSENPQFRRTDA